MHFTKERKDGRYDQPATPPSPALRPAPRRRAMLENTTRRGFFEIIFSSSSLVIYFWERILPATSRAPPRWESTAGLSRSIPRTPRRRACRTDTPPPTRAPSTHLIRVHPPDFKKTRFAEVEMWYTRALFFFCFFVFLFFFKHRRREAPLKQRTSQGRAT